VKRVLALCLIALVALSAGGCSMLEQAAGTAGPTETPATQAVTAEPSPTLEPTPTPVPTPEPTPVPVVAIPDYQYQKVSNQALGVSFDYPSHWINKPGNITISYIQPVNAGEIAARLAVSIKKTSKNLDSDGIRKELDKLIDKISGSFESFRHGSVSKKVKLTGSNAYSVLYEAEKDGQKVKGFIIVTFKSSRNRLVALHFYAPSDQYKEFDPVLKQLMGTLKLS